MKNSLKNEYAFFQGDFRHPIKITATTKKEAMTKFEEVTSNSTSGQKFKAILLEKKDAR